MTNKKTIKKIIDVIKKISYFSVFLFIIVFFKGLFFGGLPETGFFFSFEYLNYFAYGSIPFFLEIIIKFFIWATSPIWNK